MHAREMAFMPRIKEACPIFMRKKLEKRLFYVMQADFA
jgi:hypothetical protein